MVIISKEIDIFGKKILLETGKMAKQADGAVVATCEGTSVLATAVVSEDVRPLDFLPLTVDVEEKLYAAGKIPGSFFRREGRPSEGAMLTARIIDRTLRPNFDRMFRNDIQVVITVLSTDRMNPPDILGMIGASAALTLSNIPFHGPLAGVRVGYVSGDCVFNPTYQDLERSSMNLVVAGNRGAVLMVEADAREVSERHIIEALGVGQEAIGKLVEAIAELDREVRERTGERPKDEIINSIVDYLRPRYRETLDAMFQAYREEDAAGVEECNSALGSVLEEAAGEFPDRYRKIVGTLSRIVHQNELGTRLTKELEPEVEERLEKVLVDASAPGMSKADRSLVRKDAKRELLKPFIERYAGLDGPIKASLDEIEKKLMRRQILLNNRRPDGRKSFQIRKITCEVGLLPKTHGSALFTRGETQVLSIATLGAYGEKQILDDLGVEEYKSFMHHYNFPPFSSGEARPMRGPRRREIGHGALVERALQPVVPDIEEFPYTIRLVSEVLESNGSTSMASVCASSMALMDAGVPLKNKSPVGGIAMGLVVEDGKKVILSDIQGLEDAIGDMDFKVAGTREGITALQMDIKVLGVSTETMAEALEQAKQGRAFIIKAMSEAIEEPRKEISPNAPRMIQLEIPVDKIGDLIGPGGRTIRGLIDRYDVEIDVENDGRVFVFGRNRDNVEMVRKEIDGMTREPQIGDRFTGTVVKTTSFGAFVELVPGRDGLIHISKLSRGRVDRVEDVVNIGDKVEVEIDEIDNLGRINLRVIELKPTAS